MAKNRDKPKKIDRLHKRAAMTLETWKQQKGNEGNVRQIEGEPRQGESSVRLQQSGAKELARS